MSITSISIKRPTLVVVFFTVLSLIGIVCYTQLNYDLIPKLSIPVINITTQYPGASASEVENSVTKKIEDALSSLENVKDIQSSSEEGISSITLEMESDANLDISLQDAQRKISTVVALLPVNAKTPTLSKFSADESPVMKVGITGKISPQDLYQLVKDQIKPHFSKLKGVGNVSVVGGDERQVKVNIDKDRLESYNLSISQLYTAISNSNLELPTGNVKNEDEQYSIRLFGKLKNIEELRSLAISRASNGQIIKLSDVAEVIEGPMESKQLTRINGSNSIGLIIQKQSDANTVEVCRLVREQIKKLQEQHAAEGVHFEIANDSSVYTLQSANAVMEDLMLAVVIVAMVMFLFLHSLRNSFIVLISIPCSIVSVFIGLYIFDFSLNLMTLLALSLVVGVLVDDSIVVLENIFRHLEMGKDRRVAALDGRNEIGFSALAITLVDVVVFVPLSLVSGLVGNLLREFSLVVVCSTLMSLVVSFTVTPLLASRLSKLEDHTKGGVVARFLNIFEAGFNAVTRYYEGILRWGLANRKKVYLMVTVLIFGSFSLVGFGFIGSEFFPKDDRGEFMMKLETEPQYSLYQTNMVTQQVEEILFNHPEVVKVFTNVGYTSSGKGSNTANSKSELTVTIVPKEERALSVDNFAMRIKEEVMRKIPGVKVTTASVNITGSGDDAPISILLRSSNQKSLYAVADSVFNIVQSIPGIQDTKFSIEKSEPEMHVSLNREKMAQLGVSPYDVSNTVRLGFAGNADLLMSKGGSDYSINVQYDQNNRRNIGDLSTTAVTNSDGIPVELNSFATITQGLGTNKLERYDRISCISVKASVLNRPIGTVGEEIKQAVSKKISTQDVTISYKGQLEQQSDAFSSLLLAICAAIILVYLVMVALYNSYLSPFIVLFSIPVAIVGALLALALAGASLTIYSIIGFIMLIGLVAKNAILLVDFANHAREQGATLVDALVEAGKERIRPIMMTTLAMIFGMLPIALSSGASSESKSGLAWVIIGGLTSSLLITLVLVPAVYFTFEKMKSKIFKTNQQ